MAIDLDRLEALALAATPGPWRLHTHHYPFSNHYGYAVVTDEYFGDVVLSTETSPPHKGDKEDAEYLAALDPQTVLELIRLARSR